MILEYKEGYNWCSFNIDAVKLSTLFENIEKPSRTTSFEKHNAPQTKKTSTNVQARNFGISAAEHQ